MTPREQTNGCTPVHFSYEQFFTDMDMMFTDAHHGRTENPCPFIHTKNTAIYDYTVGQSLSVIVKRARTHLHSYSIFTFELLCRQDLLMERVGTARGGGEASHHSGLCIRQQLTQYHAVSSGKYTSLLLFIPRCQCLGARVGGCCYSLDCV